MTTLPQDRGPTISRNPAAKAPLLTRLLGFSPQKRGEISGRYSDGNGCIDGEEGRQIIQNVSGMSQQRIDRLDRMNESINHRHSSELGCDTDCDENISSSSVCDNDSVYDVCETIDDAMFGLYIHTESKERVSLKVQKDVCFKHDWMLDGTDSESEGEDELHISKTRRRRKFGDAALDQMLGMLELENASYTTSGSSCGSVLDGENSSPGSNINDDENRVDDNEEVIEFADFSCMDSEDGEIFHDQDNNESKKGSVSAVDVFVPENNLQNDILYEYERNETFSFEETPQEITDGIKAPEDIASDDGHLTTLGILSSSGYKPPQTIECLVSDLDAELDVTIEKCLEEPPDISATESEGSSSDHDEDCAELFKKLVKERDLEPQSVPHQQSQKLYKQPSLLMSSILLESLPVPMPSTSSDDPAASLTRRIQKNHVASKAHENNGAMSVSAIHLEDEILEARLADTIHHGYFGSTGDDCDSDHFDSIVLDEILNVPWPFHNIDLKESLLDEESYPDSDGSESINHLNFDTYISNRLSELDFAIGEVMSCILSRVSQKEDAINEGVNNIFAAELDVTTALIFSKSSQEFLHRAKNGYPLADNHNAQTGLHNVVSGSLDVLHYADSKDRLRCLLYTIDQVSSISYQETLWWKDVSSKTISPQGLQKLVDDTARLKELVRGEEVLNHAVSLSTMRDRMTNLPAALLLRIEQSIAELFARTLRSGEKGPSTFDAYLQEYESLLQSWLSCYRLRADNDKNTSQQYQSSVIAVEWSGCILKILCFEASRAFAGAMIDSYNDERIKSPDNDDHGALDEMKSHLDQIKFDSKNEMELESLTSRLLVMRLGGGHHSGALSSTFFHLCSRLVELMNLYSVTLQWHKAIIAMDDAKEDVSNIIPGGGVESNYGSDKSESNHTEVSSMSSDKGSFSSKDETSIDEARPVPENLEFCTSSVDENKAIDKSMANIRRVLSKSCEVTLINLIEAYMSQGEDLGDCSTDFATGNLRLTYDVLQQFTYFSSYFVDDDGGEEEECSALKNELAKLYQRHFRSVHIEAMKTTGQLLRHESWQLSPLELSGDTFNVEVNRENCRCGSPGQGCAYCNEASMRAIYQAVADLLLASARNDHKSKHQFLITTRSEDSGYRYCTSFAQFLEDVAPYHSPTQNDMTRRLQSCFGMTSKEFSAAVLPFVEMKPCGERSLSILTQSSANGLVKWTARLLAIGSALPLVADDAYAAVMTLFDLYILTVFRLCAGSKLNEDVLIGFGRGTTARSASSSSISLTMEADAVAPLPWKESDFAQIQEFIRSSRKRLENIVNLDKFHSSNDGMCPTSPRSKNAVINFAKRLEKEAAAAYSCFFAAILVDVASKIFNDEKDYQSQQGPLWDDLKDMATTNRENDDSVVHTNCQSLVAYASTVASIVPNLVTQTIRFATVNSMSGKELIFQVICCGRVWEDGSMHEHSNTYVDDLCERSALVWGYMSSSMRLSPPALQYTWNQLVWSAFMLLLEGFSKVPKCSTEGRSLMSMDLAALSHGLIPETVHAELEDDYAMISPPPQACREDMMRYVDTFIKVFYFPNEDIISWIKDNSRHYHVDHSLALVTAKGAGSKDKRFMTHGKKSVIGIYNQTK
ncbi:hypothetical protein ACHAXR_012979 [Thalassiosira sp. AJA248-18]